MSIKKTLEINSINYESTLALGLHVGKRLLGGEIFELIGDLGAGKTAFTRGVAAGANSKDEVSSPSFTISNLYDTGDVRIYHFDFYRLSEAGIMLNELKEALSEPSSVSILEWGDIVQEILPAYTIHVQIDHAGDDKRQIKVTYPLKYDYLFMGYKI